MAPAFRFSRQIYAAVLLLYPAALRRQFGEEMIEGFTDQMHDAQQKVVGWAKRGSGAVLPEKHLSTAVSSHLQIVGISSLPA